MSNYTNYQIDIVTRIRYYILTALNCSTYGMEECLNHDKFCVMVRKDELRKNNREICKQHCHEEGDAQRCEGLCECENRSKFIFLALISNLRRFLIYLLWSLRMYYIIWIYILTLGSQCPKTSCQTMSVSLNDVKGDRRPITVNYQLVDDSRNGDILTYKNLENQYMKGGTKSSWKVQM